MIDINLIRNNIEVVKQNIEKKYQHHKLVLVDEVFNLDIENRKLKQQIEELRFKRNQLSKEIGVLMSEKRKDEAEKTKLMVKEFAIEMNELEQKQLLINNKIQELMLKIPNIISDKVPLGKDDSENVELKKYSDIKVKNFEIPYHVDILEAVGGIDLEAARKVSGNGFYYLIGDIARLHSALITFARDFMIEKGFTYVIPPYMIRSDVVTGVMSFEEMESMMYKVEGEDLYLIGTSEHSMIGKFIDTILEEPSLPYQYTSYSPCFRKEVGAHGIEERGIYRVHQFEKQEMVVICSQEESEKHFENLYNYTAEFFTLLDIPVRALECCSGDLADLKVRSIDIEAYSPRQKKYFEVGSCSNLGDAQARRLAIRYNAIDGSRKFAHTLNNTVVAPPRMLIAFLENNLNEDGSISIPKPLQMYMGGKTKILKK